MNEQAGVRNPAGTTAPPSASLVDRESHFSGNYRTARDLQIEGRFEGDIECKGTVYISESATVAARIMAGSVLIAGQLEGEVVCDSRFEVLPTGRVSAAVSTTVTVVHEGAFYQGDLRMTHKGEAPRASLTPARPAAPTPITPARAVAEPAAVEREASPPSPRPTRRTAEPAPEPTSQGDAPLSLATPALSRVNGNGAANGHTARAD